MNTSADPDQTTFMKPARRRAAMLSRIKLYGRRPSEAETTRTRINIVLLFSTYFLIGVIINMIDPEYLVAAWLFIGLLGVTAYVMRQSKKSVVNVYTVLLGVCVVGCLAGFVLSRGLLI
jgi:hypothetical protein